MKVHYITCARSSSLDTKTNQLSLFHILDEIAGPTFPLVLPAICVAALFEREPEDAPVQSFIMAVTLEGRLVVSFNLSVDFTKTRRSRAVNTIQGLTLSGPGVATISLLQKSRVLATWQSIVVQEGGRPEPAEVAPKPAEETGPRTAARRTAVVVH